MLATFVLLTLTSILLAPFYHLWYWKMRQRDDRGQAGNFHRGNS
jgi:hypothetical protein